MPFVDDRSRLVVQSSHYSSPYDYSHLELFGGKVGALVVI